MEKLRGINEIAQYLNISKNTLYCWVSSQRIPHIKMGRLVKFRVEEIDRWLDERRIEPNSKWREVENGSIP